MRIKWSWHNTTAISRLLTTDLHGWEQKLDLSIKGSTTSPYSNLVLHQFFLLHIYDRNWIFTSQTLERISFLCNDFSSVLKSPSVCWHLCERSCWKELTSFKDFVFKTCWKKSHLFAWLCAQLELSFYFTCLFLGSRVWSCRHAEDALHLPVNTLPPILSLLCLQQPPQWLETAGWPWRWCTPKGTRTLGEVGIPVGIQAVPFRASEWSLHWVSPDWVCTTAC